VTRPAGLRERKKRATREALRDAALRLALEHGPENVRVDDIAEAAGVSPRTYNNYFASREQAIVAAITAEREARIGAAVAARPAGVRLADAVIDAVVEQYTDRDERAREAMLLVTTSPALRHAFVRSITAVENPLADAIGRRLGDDDPYTARVLAASVAAAIQVALGQWLQPSQSSAAPGGLVVPHGSLPDLLRNALAPLAPALDAAEAT
jgi:AcrR family transcriptional regulator